MADPQRVVLRTHLESRYLPGVLAISNYRPCKSMTFSRIWKATEKPVASAAHIFHMLMVCRSLDN
jgi:hypothetical protein